MSHPESVLRAEHLREAADDPDVVALLARVLRCAATSFPQDERIQLVRIDGWFGPRWLGFAGKLVGALGVRRGRRVPPFHPSRVRGERAWIQANGRWVETGEFRRLHAGSRRASEENVSERARCDREGEILVWAGFSAAVPDHAALMVYRFGESGDHYWYLGFRRGPAGWRLEKLVGTISRPELTRLMEE